MYTSRDAPLANAEEAARETKKRGAAEFVSKGCDFNVLLAAIRNAPDSKPAEAKSA